MSKEVVYTTPRFAVEIGVHQNFAEDGTPTETHPVYVVRNVQTDVNEYKDFNLLACMQFADSMNAALDSFYREKNKDDLFDVTH